MACIDTREAVLALSEEDPEFVEYVKSNGPLHNVNATHYEQFREAISQAEAQVVEKLGPLEADLEEFEMEIALPDGWKSQTIITRPRDSLRQPGPLIVLFYGGGFMCAGPKQNLAYARGFARLFGATVALPSFRHAPEHPFPTGPEDGWQTLKWCAGNASSLHADPAKGFITGGISSGANFGAVLARRAVEEKLNPPLTGQWISLLVGFRAHTVPAKYSPLWVSWDQNAKTMVINKATGEQLFDLYNVDFEDPMFCPLARTKEGKEYVPMKETAAAFIQCCGIDLIRDDGIVYHQALQDAGVKSKLAVYPGLPHSWWHAVPTLNSSRKMLIDIANGFAWMLGQEIEETTILEKLWLPT